MKTIAEHEEVASSVTMPQVKLLVDKLIAAVDEAGSQSEAVVPAALLMAFTAYTGGTVRFENAAELQQFVGDAIFFMSDWADRVAGKVEVKH